MEVQSLYKAACMLSYFRPCLALLTAALLLPASSSAFDSPLSGEAVREAYFLGQQNDDKTLAFFSLYTRHLPLPQEGPYVSEVALLTPYAQVVEQSRQNSVGYSVQQAELDYRGRGNSIRLRVLINFTPTYGYAEAAKSAENAGGEMGVVLHPEDFWRAFRFVLKQKGEAIEPREFSAERIYRRGEDATLGGAYVTLEYDAKDVGSE